MWLETCFPVYEYHYTIAITMRVRTAIWDTWVAAVSHCTGILHWDWSPYPIVVPKRLIYDVVLTWSLITVLKGMQFLSSSKDCDCGCVGRLMENYISQTKTTSIYRLMSSTIHKYSIFWSNLPSAPYHFHGKYGFFYQVCQQSSSKEDQSAHKCFSILVEIDLKVHTFHAVILYDRSWQTNCYNLYFHCGLAEPDWITVTDTLWFVFFIDHSCILCSKRQN